MVIEMDDKLKIGLVVGLLIVFAVGAYFAYGQISYQKEYNRKALYCEMLTEQLNNKSVHSVNESSPCVNYYCTPTMANPEDFNGMTEPMCQCQCKTVNGTTLNIWVGTTS